ncbi:MAG: TetR/AcrR family transcriptional regulator [Deltaproteobacteria bacterium]|nr:TetR/AcrR family transcriptional regulator [Deltaproteobacteria bacterium]
MAQSTAPPLQSVSRPKQARSERTLQSILEAAEELIEEKGLADSSIPEIVRRAGSSVGGFYARFKDKNELLSAIEERFFRDMSALVDQLADGQRWSDTGLPAIVQVCASELVRIARQRRNLIAAFLQRATDDPATRADALRFRASVSERIGRLVLSRSERITHPQPEIAVDLGVQFAFALMLHLVLMGEVRAAGRVLSDEELATEISRNFLSYVAPQESS